VYLGFHNGLAQAQWKYVIGHEIGHQVADRLIGGWYGNLTLAAPANQLCACPANPPGESHCLQSSEEQGAAQDEGYGHYYAGNIWNARTDPECVFTYYKNFQPAGGVPAELAPVAKSCRQAARWAETHCQLPGRATEYDWMGFYTSISRASAPGAIPQTDLRRVYGRMCTGSPTGSCTYLTSSTWAGLDSAASSEFLPGTPRYLTFHNNGDVYGVTR
jgi:hypothetical protein